MSDMVKVPDITITSLDTITAWDNGKFAFMLDELTDATISNSQETEDITGKGGRLLNRLKRNKACTVSGTNGLVSGGLLEAQTGGKFEFGEPVVDWMEYLTVNSNAATTTYKAVGTAGAEIKALFVHLPDGRLGVEYDQVTTLPEGAEGAGKFTYTAGTKTLTFSSGAFQDGQEIVVYYQRKLSEAYNLENDSTVYSKKLELFIDATGEDRCSNTVYHIQIHIPRADFEGNFDLQMGDNQTVHDFEAQALSGSCGASGNLWDYTIFGATVSDAL